MNPNERWGVFDSKGVATLPPGEYHVIPCDGSDEPLPGHTWDATCPCNPTVEIRAAGTVVITHEDLSKKILDTQETPG